MINEIAEPLSRTRLSPQPDLQPVQSLAEHKIRIIKGAPKELPDRSAVYSQIMIKVSVFSSKTDSFHPVKVYAIDPDMKIEELCNTIRIDYQILDRDKYSNRDDSGYQFYFETLKLEPSKRFAELSFVSGDRFYFCPPSQALVEATAALAEYMRFVFEKETKPTFRQQTAYFSLPQNKFQLKPHISLLSRMSYYELGHVPNFVIQNAHGKIEFLEPVDLRYLQMTQEHRPDKDGLHRAAADRSLPLRGSQAASRPRLERACKPLLLRRLQSPPAHCAREVRDEAPALGCLHAAHQAGLLRCGEADLGHPSEPLLVYEQRRLLITCAVYFPPTSSSDSQPESFVCDRRVTNSSAPFLMLCMYRLALSSSSRPSKYRRTSPGKNRAILDLMFSAKSFSLTSTNTVVSLRRTFMYVICRSSGSGFSSCFLSLVDLILLIVQRSNAGSGGVSAPEDGAGEIEWSTRVKEQRESIRK